MTSLLLKLFLLSKRIGHLPVLSAWAVGILSTAYWIGEDLINKIFSSLAPMGTLECQVMTIKCIDSLLNQ